MMKFCYSRIFLLCSYFVISSLYGMDRLEIDYTPIRILRSGQILPVELTLTNFSGVPVREVWVHFRYAGEGKFNSNRLNNQGFRYYTDLKFEKLGENLAEYYFSIHYLDNKRETFPSDAGSGNLFRTALQITRNYGNDIIIISPEEEEHIFETDLVITASYSSFASMIDAEQTKVYLDTWEISRYILKYEDFISFAPRKVPLGRHKIRLELFDENANLIASREWYFTSVPSRSSPTSGSDFKLSGRFFAEAREEQLQDRSVKNDYNQTGLNLRGGIGNLSLGGKVYLNNREASDRQPINRFSGYTRLNFWKGRYINLDFGDSYPKFNPLLLQNILMRGVHGSLFLKFFNLDVVYGKTLRAIEAKTHPEIVSGQPVTVVDRWGTYERKILAVRPSFGGGELMQWGFSYLKGQDDTTSVDFGRVPQENIAVGSDVFIGLDNQRITFEGNINVSILNRNITGGTVPYDTLKQNFEDLSEGFYDLAQKYITLNQYLVPLPNVAYQARMHLRYFRNNISFLYESVDEDYFSFGQPYLLTDNQGFHIVDNINLISNQVFLTVGYRQYHNNLRNIKSSTTNNTNIYANLTYYPVQGLPEISVGFNNYTRENGISADSIDSILNRPEDNRTNTINVTAGYPFVLQTLKNRISLSFMNYRRDDIFKITESNSDYFSINFITDYTFPLRTQLEFITQNTESGNNTTYESRLKLNSFGGGIQYIFYNVFANDQLMFKTNARFGNIKATAYSYNRNFLTFRINYSVPHYGNFGLSADWLTYSGNRNFTDLIYSVRYDVSF
jgi:hypothetical protein